MLKGDGHGVFFGIEQTVEDCLGFKSFVRNSGVVDGEGDRGIAFVRVSLFTRQRL